MWQVRGYGVRVDRPWEARRAERPVRERGSHCGHQAKLPKSDRPGRSISAGFCDLMYTIRLAGCQGDTESIFACRLVDRNVCPTSALADRNACPMSASDCSIGPCRDRQPYRLPPAFSALGAVLRSGSTRSSFPPAAGADPLLGRPYPPPGRP